MAWVNQVARTGQGMWNVVGKELSNMKRNEC